MNVIITGAPEIENCYLVEMAVERSRFDVSAVFTGEAWRSIAVKINYQTSKV